ncbi:hypothetical protein [Demequina sp. NBRC 110054]|uniref:hypothetical protein n=1 Tax=Demequina sp. NBRC 110054 TaxID=1570343 RepID=UPI000A06317D|nr:hypothetical protein [Demequina sp. NBRC 110054]
MRLRTTALIAGLLGVVALVVGLVAQSQRPESTVTVPATVDTAAVIVPADMLAFAEGGRYAVDGEGTLLAFSALPVDLEAWASDKVVTYVEGMPTWDGLTATVADMSPAPSASPSASEESDGDAKDDEATEDEKTDEKATDKDTTDDAATADEAADGDAANADDEAADASPSASSAADEPQYESLLQGSTDLWRDSWTGTDRLSVGAADVEVGLDLVFVSEDGSPLTSVDLKLSREVNDAWITPLIVWGGILTGVGFLALLLLVFDVRPVQARAEEWIAHRQRIGAGDEGPKPGSRRARRLEGAAIPAAEITPEEQPEIVSAGQTAPGEPAAPSGDFAEDADAVQTSDAYAPIEPVDTKAADGKPAAEEAASESPFLPPEQAVQPDDEEEDR